jgi:hypothetical protein
MVADYSYGNGKQAFSFLEDGSGFAYYKSGASYKRIANCLALFNMVRDFVCAQQAAWQPA